MAFFFSCGRSSIWLILSPHVRGASGRMCASHPRRHAKVNKCKGRRRPDRSARALEPSRHRAPIVWKGRAQGVRRRPHLAERHESVGGLSCEAQMKTSALHSPHSSPKLRPFFFLSVLWVGSPCHFLSAFLRESERAREREGGGGAGEQASCRTPCRRAAENSKAKAL